MNINKNHIDDDTIQDAVQILKLFRIVAQYLTP